MNEYAAAKYGLGMAKVRRDMQIYTAYQTVLNACERLCELDPKLKSPEGQLLDGLAKALEKYEKKMYPLPKCVRPVRLRGKQ